MTVELKLPDEIKQYLNIGATDEAKKCLQLYTDDLLNEAGRLEAEYNSTGGDPEITRTNIADADLHLRRRYQHVRKSNWLIFGKIFSPIGGLVTGLIGSLGNLTDPINFIGFTLFLIVTVTATVLLVVKE